MIRVGDPLGTDYFLIDNTNKKYMWLGRHNLGEGRITKHALRNYLTELLMDDIYEILDYPDTYFESDFYTRYYSYIEVINSYIKGKECYCQNEYKAINNEFTEDLSFRPFAFVFDYIGLNYKRTMSRRLK